MAIQLNSLRLVTVPAKAAPPNQARALAPGARTSLVPAKPASAKASALKATADFGSVLSGGLAAAGAASANARSAATAAATHAAAAASLTATAAAKSATTAASPATAATSDPNAVLTAEQVFGANPWLADPTGSGPNGVTFPYNPLYFASASTAADVAQMVGGTVVQDDEFTKDTAADPFAQQQPNEMVELPGGALINPGLIASLYTHGYPNSIVNQAIASEVAGAEASVTTTGT
jgi:hypothetical protein